MGSRATVGKDKHSEFNSGQYGRGFQVDLGQSGISLAIFRKLVGRNRVFNGFL